MRKMSKVFRRIFRMLKNLYSLVDVGHLMDIKLKRIRKPPSNTRVLLEPKLAQVLPVIRGNGDINLLCGKCGTILIQGIFGEESKTSLSIAQSVTLTITYLELSVFEVGSLLKTALANCWKQFECYYIMKNETLISSKFLLRKNSRL